MISDDRSPQHIGRADLELEPWANGKGLTLPIAADHQDAGDGIRWRLSLALLSENSAFSGFDKTDRVFTVVGQHGVELVFEHGRRRCEPGFPIRFPGEHTPLCLVTHPTTAFNVMVDFERAAATVVHHKAFIEEPIRVEASSRRLVNAVFLMSGKGRFDNIEMAPGDTVIAGYKSSVFYGSHDVLLVTIARIDAPFCGAGDCLR